jgi:hypothetical protein
MRNYCKTIGALAAASAFAAGNASAVDLDYNLHAGYTNEYIFRGVNQGEDLVEAGFDVSADVGFLNLSAGAWYGSYEAAGVLDGDELDLYGKVSHDFGFVEASVGYIWYDNERLLGDILGDSQEVFFGLSKEFYGVKTSLTYYWDVETDNDGYADFSVSKSFELTGCLTLNVGSSLAYLVEEGHLAHSTTKVSLDWAFAEHAKFSPFVAGTVDLSGGHGINYGSGSIFGPAKNQLVGGAMVSLDF